MQRLDGFTRRRATLARTLTLTAVWVFAGCTRDAGRELTAPRPYSPQVLTERELQLEAYLVAHDTAYARNSYSLRPTGPSRLIAIDDPDDPYNPPRYDYDPYDPESQVTSGGLVGTTTVTGVDYDWRGATWAASTKVTSGFARRVFLQTVGGYNKLTAFTSTTPNGYKIERFSDTCGESFTEIFKQHCLIGDSYFDIDCYGSSGAGIYASSQHSVTWRFTSQSLQPTSSTSRCRTTSYGGGGGSGCHAFTIIDNWTGTEPVTPPCTGSGSGAGDDEGDDPYPNYPLPDDPNPTGGTNLCVQYFLDPGCYDLYIDGSYDSTICC